jgi:hypothetical protein
MGTEERPKAGGRRQGYIAWDGSGWTIAQMF